MVEGRNQSVLSDAWAKSAQILEFPEQMPSWWEITNAAKTELREQLSRDCDGFTVMVSMELSRENPEVGIPAGIESRTRRLPRPSGRRSCRGNSANILRAGKIGGSFLDETAFLEAIPAVNSIETRRSFIEIPHLWFSVSPLIFRFPRLFYLSSSSEIRFVDTEKPRFDSLYVPSNSIEFPVVVHVLRQFRGYLGCCVTAEHFGIRPFADPRGQRPGFELYAWRGFWREAFVAAEFTMIGVLDSTNVGIVGLYMAILITVGGVVRQFLLPKVSDLMWK